MQNYKRWFPNSTNILHFTLGLCGEAGEVANIVKKINRGSLSSNDAQTRLSLAMELADVYIYLLNIFALLNIDPDKVYEQKTAFNEKRFAEERRRKAHIESIR